ncbi:MAG: ATP-dependent DNA helicase RecG [Planctomycetota bacterium]|nr:ATP-dependent DNA helicase RecG [Planctomycetota bacterium]
MLSDEVRYIKGVGPVRAERLAVLDIRTVSDLLFHLPYRYIDRREKTEIARLRLGERQTIVGRVVEAKAVPTRSRLHIVSATLEDGTGRIDAVWFNQPYILDKLKEGTLLSVTGKMRLWKRPQIAVEEYEVLGESIRTDEMLSVYSVTEGVGQKFLRRIIRQALSEVRPYIVEHLPEYLLNKRNLARLADALWMVHFPESEEELQMGLRRLKYDEFLLLQLIVASRKKRTKNRTGVQLKVTPKIEERIFARIPFPLTKAQKNAIQEIKRDLTAKYPMNRLLQGDVGCGKTIVSLYAMLVAVANGMQAAMMAPTEVLAEQHHLLLKRLLEGSKLKIGCLTASTESKETLLRMVANGDIQILVGTHALFSEGVCFKNLALVVIDEQQKFGVEQRLKLLEKAQAPNLLTMTATPIPRSLALTIFGDTDVSLIDKMPPGRIPPKTSFLSKNEFEEAVEFVRQRLRKGEQAFVVCPSIEDIDENQRGAISAFKDWKEKMKGYGTVELLHGKMPPEKRDIIMERFRAAKIGLLVATTVIEVGVDVVNATVMVIENAQRFGLAQLHQLRGRIGRSTKPSWCILTGDISTEEARKRIQVLLDTNDGFKIAEEDLRMRGPGEFFGEKQSGLPDLKIADLINDYPLLVEAREDAQELLQEGKMNEREESILRKWVMEKTGSKWRFLIQ